MTAKKKTLHIIIIITYRERLACSPERDSVEVRSGAAGGSTEEPIAGG